MYNWREIICGRLADAGLDPIADSSLIEELAQHMDDRFAESRARGAAEDEATHSVNSIITYGSYLCWQRTGPL